MEKNIMRSNYKILPQYKLILEYLAGIVKIDSVVTHRKILYNDPNFNTKYDFLLDLRDAKIDITLEEFNNYINYLQSLGNVFDIRKSALIVRNANQIAYTNAFKAFEGKIPIQIQFFNNLNDCIKWLDLEQESNEVCNLHEKLIADCELQWQNEKDSLSSFL